MKLEMDCFVKLKGEIGVFFQLLPGSVFPFWMGGCRLCSRVVLTFDFDFDFGFEYVLALELLNDVAMVNVMTMCYFNDDVLLLWWCDIITTMWYCYYDDVIVLWRWLWRVHSMSVLWRGLQVSNDDYDDDDDVCTCS